MWDLRSWSFGKVVLASIFWVTLDLVLVAVYLYLKVWRASQSTGSGGIGAVSGGVGVLSAMGILFGPPIVLFVVWYFMRRP